MNRCTWKICRLFLCGLIGCCVTVAGATSAAGSKAPAGKTPVAKAPPSEEETMAAMVKLAAPAPHHAALKAFEGSWKTVTKTWNPKGETVLSEGTSEGAMIIGGRYLKDEYHGSMMGQPFEGFGITGYDNARKKYVSTWMDSLNTNISVQTGTMDATGKVLTFKSSMEDPVTHQKTPMKMVTKIVDDRTHVFSMYSQAGGKDKLEMEITSTRK